MEYAPPILILQGFLCDTPLCYDSIIYRTCISQNVNICILSSSVCVFKIVVSLRMTYPRLKLVAHLDKLSVMSECTRCRRNSELIINKNILLKVIDTNFSTSQFTMVLNFISHSFTFCVQCLLGGHHPPQCTGAHELRSCA
jgi:hypothetical protein